MNNNYCLANILKVINVLQNNAGNMECNDAGCTKPFLGDTSNIVCFNTRLIILYRCDNNPIVLPYRLDDVTETTTIFRVVNVNDDSVNVLLIEDNGDGTYTNTNTYATINLKCICAIQCIGDIALENL